MRKAWDAVRSAADVPWLRVHDLRHTAITRFAEAGVSIPVILSMAGHISTRMQQHYTAISEFAKRRAVEAAFESGNYMVTGGRLVGEEEKPGHDIWPVVQPRPVVRRVGSLHRRKTAVPVFDSAD